jgi:ABC-type Fe3+/spermidine/putrescine transport system ATPase subunit
MARKYNSKALPRGKSAPEVKNLLELTNVYKSYESEPLLQGISFTVHQKEIVCLLGPSGSGKSTLLRIIAGLESPEHGQISWDGLNLASTPSHLRDFGLVFQDYALFPHLDVYDNVAFGLKMRQWSPDKIQMRVGEVLDLVNLARLGSRNVTDLSGGEQQRVALARALAPHPRLLMFDEPLGALDRTLRESLLEQLRLILHQTGLPAVYVTHDQNEAFAIADRVLLLHDGKIVREGTAVQVWLHPGSAWAAEFLGIGNVIQGKMKRRGKIVETDYGIIRVHCRHNHEVGDMVHLLARPIRVGGARSLQNEDDRSSQAGSLIRDRVVDVTFERDIFKVKLEHGLHIYLPAAPRLGEKIKSRVVFECLG